MSTETQRNMSSKTPSHLLPNGPTFNSTVAKPPPPFGPAVHHTPTHLFFYGYELQLPESYLQNWYPAVFTSPDHPDAKFPTMEHYIMYRKALAMGDTVTASKVLDAPTPTAANKLGRQVKPYDGEVWQGMVDEVAETGTYLKFSQIEELRDALMLTGEKVLVESNPADGKWGIGLRGDEAEGREAEWGGNIAGKALMRVRERLRRELEDGTSNAGRRKL